MTETRLYEEYAETLVLETVSTRLVETYAETLAARASLSLADFGAFPGTFAWWRLNQSGVGAIGSAINGVVDQTANAFDANLTGAVVFIDPVVISVVTDSTHYGPVAGDGPGSYAFDGSASSYWTFASTAPAWVKIQLATAAVVTNYTMLRRDDLPNRNPTAWTLEGSNDNSTWTTLDTRTGITWPTASENKSFAFTNSTAYLYYRWTVTANGGDTSFSSITEITVTRDRSTSTKNWVRFTGGSMKIGRRGFAWADASVSSTLNSGIDGSWPHLLDANTGTYWTTNAVPTGTLTMTMVRARVATQYVIRGRDDILNRNPKNWTFEGSNNGSSWTTLDTQTNITWSAGQTKTFNFSNSTAYLYYRLVVTANNGDTYLSFTEFWIGPAATWPPLVTREMWVVMRPTAVGGVDWQLGTSGLQSLHTFSDGKVYDDAFTTTRTSWTPSLALTNNVRLYRVIARSNGTWVAYIDASQEVALTGKFLGEHSLPAILTTFTGDLMEAALMSMETTADEQANLIYYVNTQHGTSIAGGVSGGGSTPSAGFGYGALPV